MFVRFPSFFIMIIYSIDEYYRTIDDHIILPYENQQKSNICTLRGSRSALLLAHIHMYVRIWVCVYVYLWISLSYELWLLVEYCSKPLCREISILLSRPSLCTSHGLFHNTIYNIFLFYYLYFFSFFFYSLGTPRAKRYNRLYLSRAHYIILTLTLIGKAILIRIFLFVLLGKASNCSKRVLDD